MFFSAAAFPQFFRLVVQDIHGILAESGDDARSEIRTDALNEAG